MTGFWNVPASADADGEAPGDGLVDPGTGPDGDGSSRPPDNGDGRPPPPPTSALPRRFYGSVKLNPLRLGSSAGQIGDEIVKHLTALVDADVEVVLEVRARVESGIPEQTARTIGENARTLKFQSFEFEEE